MNTADLLDDEATRAMESGLHLLAGHLFDLARDVRSGACADVAISVSLSQRALLRQASAARRPIPCERRSLLTHEAAICLRISEELRC